MIDRRVGAGSHRRHATEVELKLAAEAGFVIPPLDQLEERISAMHELPVQELHSTYHDTPDLRLARRGITLRFRSGEELSGWTLKFPVDAREILTRSELGFQAPEDEVPEEARRLLTVFILTAPLIPVAQLTTVRRRWLLIGGKGEAVAELADDQVSVIEDGSIIGGFREIEIEEREGDSEILERVGRRLQESGAVAAEPIPKLVRALGQRVTAPPELGVPPPVGPKQPAGAAVQAALMRSVERLMRNDPPVRLGDPEGVHRMRVAVRRLRSDLRTFAPLLQDGWADGVKDELGWLATRLGDVRDLDVLQARLQRVAKDLEGDLGPLLKEVDARHASARAALHDSLESPEYLVLVEKLIRAAGSPSFTPDADRSSDETLPSLVSLMWKKLSRGARAVRPTSDNDDLHRVRILAKRVRYAAEAVAPALGGASEDAKEFAALAEDIQETLGEHQDALVAAKTIVDIFDEAKRPPRDLSLSVGRLLERELQAAASARNRWPKAWEKMDRKKRRKWLQA